MPRLDHHMVDKHGRRMRKLRISLLDACNLRCLYCMPEHPAFMPQKDWANTKDLVRITCNLVKLGIEEVRITGGEPLLRRDFIEIVNRLSTLPIKKLALTTNALLLAPYLPLFMEEGIDLKPLASANYPAVLAANIAIKPTGRIPHQPQPMYQIGG